MVPEWCSSQNHPPAPVRQADEALARAAMRGSRDEANRTRWASRISGSHRRESPGEEETLCPRVVFRKQRGHCPEESCRTVTRTRPVAVSKKTSLERSQSVLQQTRLPPPHQRLGIYESGVRPSTGKEPPFCAPMTWRVARGQNAAESPESRETQACNFRSLPVGQCTSRRQSCS